MAVQNESKEDVLRRLNRIEGEMKGVERLVGATT